MDDRIIGKKFNNVTVVSFSHIKDKYRKMYNCLCHCGNKFICRGDAIEGGYTRSCGCSQKIWVKSMAAKTLTTHGKSNSKIYITWKNIHNRTRPNWPEHKYYFDKGITVCDRWKKFENFYKDMGDIPDNKSIDRIDGNKGYSPDNCRWATKIEQANNRCVYKK